MTSVAPIVSMMPSVPRSIHGALKRQASPNSSDVDAMHDRQASSSDDNGSQCGEYRVGYYDHVSPPFVEPMICSDSASDQSSSSPFSPHSLNASLPYCNVRAADSPKRARIAEYAVDKDGSQVPQYIVPSIQVSETVSVAPVQVLKPRQRYQITSVLRDSLFGKVVVANCLRTEQQVAIKLSNLKLIEMGRTWKGARVCESPLEESRIMRLVAGHPNILALLDEQCENNVHWMVMEYAPNGEFFDYVCQKTHLEETEARKYFGQMLSALVHLHERNICHLDFSLENMLLDAKHNVKICDFGVARFMVPGTKFAAAGGSSPKPGKLRYMAPELLEGQCFDGRAVDVFALGVTLFCMLTGNIPFASAAPTDPGYTYICAGKLPAMLDLLKLRHRVPALACDLLARMLQPHARSRISLAEVARHPWVVGF